MSIPRHPLGEGVGQGCEVREDEPGNGNEEEDTQQEARVIDPPGPCKQNDVRQPMRTQAGVLVVPRGVGVLQQGVADQGTQGGN